MVNVAGLRTTVLPIAKDGHTCRERGREGGRERGREGGRERGREGGSEGVRERARE